MFRSLWVYVNCTVRSIYVHVVHLKYVVYKYYTFNDVDGELYVPLCRYILHKL